MQRVVVVGAGPAGAAAALVAARCPQLEVVLLDRQALPRDKICAGGISARAQSALQRLGVASAVLAEAHAIAQLRVSGPAGETFVLSRSRSVVLPRTLFDYRLVQAARAAGAKLRDGVCVRGLLRNAQGVCGVQTEQEALEADWVVVAAGSSTTPLLLCPGSQKHTAIALMTRIETQWPDDRAQEMHFLADLLPGYGWVFPEGGGRINAGVMLDVAASSGPARLHLERFLEAHVLPRARAHRFVGPWVGQRIDSVSLLPNLGAPGVLWVGEACGLSSWATGEGISHALESGASAGHALVSAALGRASAPPKLHQRFCRLWLQPRLLSSWAFASLAGHRAFAPLVSLAGAIPLQGLLRGVLERA